MLCGKNKQMNTLIHEEKYRGDGLLKKMAEQELIVCGAGALGSNIVENMARQGFKKFTVIDFDRVDDHNRHTQAYDRRDVGQLKVAALKSKIFNIMGFSITDIAKKLEESNLKKYLKKDSLIIDGFDNSESRGLITKYCLENDILCLHAGLYKDYAEIRWNPVYRVPAPVKGLDVCEYPLARNIVMMASIVTIEIIINYLELGVFNNFEITLKDMTISNI
jgi:molybdopterin/thiamine biosynthesis adenylyltransferase